MKTHFLQDTKHLKPNPSDPFTSLTMVSFDVKIPLSSLNQGWHLKVTNI